jgi:quercetin dioxygenase-like cupin family protein
MSEYRLTQEERVTVRMRTTDLLEAELCLEPGGRRPPAHRHPAQDERFEVLKGTLSVKIDGSAVRVGAGEALHIPRGVAHTMGAADGNPVRARWQTRPALQTERWWASLDDAMGRSPNGHIPLRVLARLLRAHGAEFELASRLLAFALAVVAMLPLGFRQPRRRSHKDVTKSSAPLEGDADGDL